MSSPGGEPRHDVSSVPPSSGHGFGSGSEVFLPGRLKKGYISPGSTLRIPFLGN